MTVQYRNVSDDDRAIAYGVPHPVWVPVDGVIDVDDEAAAGFDCQPAIWARTTPAEQPAAPTEGSAEPTDAPAVTAQPAEPTVVPKPTDVPAATADVSPPETSPAEPAQPTQEQPT